MDAGDTIEAEKASECNEDNVAHNEFEDWDIISTEHDCVCAYSSTSSDTLDNAVISDNKQQLTVDSATANYGDQATLPNLVVDDWITEMDHCLNDNNASSREVAPVAKLTAEDGFMVSRTYLANDELLINLKIQSASLLTEDAFRETFYDTADMKLTRSGCTLKRFSFNDNQWVIEPDASPFSNASATKHVDVADDAQAKKVLGCYIDYDSDLTTTTDLVLPFHTVEHRRSTFLVNGCLLVLDSTDDIVTALLQRYCLHSIRTSFALHELQHTAENILGLQTLSISEF